MLGAKQELAFTKKAVLSWLSFATTSMPREKTRYGRRDDPFGFKEGGFQMGNITQALMLLMEQLLYSSSKKHWTLQLYIHCRI